MAHELRPMGIGEIFDVAFRLYRSRFATFLLIALMVYVPYALIVSVTNYATLKEFYDRQAQFEQMTQEEIQQWLAEAPEGPAPANRVVGYVVGNLGIALFALIVFPLCTGAMVQNISAGYLGEELGAAESYRLAAPRLLSLLLANFLSTLLMFVGFLLCVVPGIIVTIWFLLISATVVLERARPIRALERSRDLMKGNLSKGFSLVFLVSLLSGVIYFGLGFCLALVPWPHVVLGLFFEEVIGAVILPIQTAVPVLLYYDLRIRKEAFDLERLAADFGALGET